MNENGVPITVETLLSEQDWLRALARRLVSDDARADDLLQDVWLKVVSRPPRAVRSVRAWLTRVLVNRHRDVRRSEGARSVREDVAAPRRDAPSAADLVARVDAQQRVAAAVLELDEPLRETVLLRFFEDLPVRSIARRMGVPYETARARLAKGLAHLRSRLAPEDGRGGRRWSAGLLALAGVVSTGDAAAAAALTGVVIAMKTKLTVAVAVIILLAAGIGGWPLISRDTPEPAPGSPPEDVAVLPVETADEPAAPETPPTSAVDATVPTTTHEEKLDPKKGTVHGRITHADGTPAAGEMVRLSGRPAKVVRTDAEGRYRIVNEWVDQMARTFYVGPKTGLLALGSVPLRVGEDVEFHAVIPVGKPLAVEVLSAVDGRPLAGVWICLDPLTEPAFPRALCVTDESGKGEVPHLSPRDFRVYVASQGYRPYRRRLDLTAGGAPDVLRIRLEDPEELRLHVVPAPAKKAYVNVSLIPIPDDPVQGQFFNGGDLPADGVFVGIAPPPGKYWAHVQVYGVAQWTIKEVVVREREPVEITVRRKAGAEVRGTLLGPDGRPTSGRVILHPNLSGPDSAERRASATEKGEFHFPEVPACSAWIDVRVGRQTFGSVLKDLVIPEEGIPDIVVRLPKGASVSGRIEGSKQPNAHFLTFYRQTEEGWENASWMSPDGRGRFRARHLKPGRYVLQTNPVRGEQGWARPVSFDIREGEEVEPIVVTWLPCPEVEIVVTAADGAPVTGKIRVQAVPRDTGEASSPGEQLRYFDATLDEKGMGVLRSLAARAYFLRVTADGKSAMKPVEVQETRNPPLRIQLPD